VLGAEQVAMQLMVQPQQIMRVRHQGTARHHHLPANPAKLATSVGAMYPCSVGGDVAVPATAAVAAASHAAGLHGAVLSAI